MIFTATENAASKNATTNKREIIMVDKGNFDEAIAAKGEEIQWRGGGRNLVKEKNKVEHSAPV